MNRLEALNALVSGKAIALPEVYSNGHVVVVDGVIHYRSKDCDYDAPLAHNFFNRDCGYEFYVTEKEILVKQSELDELKAQVAALKAKIAELEARGK